MLFSSLFDQKLYLELLTMASLSSTSCITPTVASKLKINIMLTNIDILEETMKVTQKEIDALNERIDLEFNRRPLTQLQSDLLDIYLKQHRNTLSQYKKEYKLFTKLKMKLALEVEKGVNAGTISIDPILSNTNKSNNCIQSEVDDDEKVNDEIKSIDSINHNGKKGKCGMIKTSQIKEKSCGITN